MYVLGIDTSCDDTSAAVVVDGRAMASNIVSSQSALHGKFGGIVPELASRRHIEMIWPVVEEALGKAGTRLGRLDAIAVCHGPGLIGSLLVGCSFAKALSLASGTPLVAVNHLEGHIYSTFLEARSPEYPFLSLIASGGHTSLLIVEGFGRYRELGRTRDDAAGEAFDKVAKLLGLGYPGGPVIDRLSREGNRKAFDLPRAYVPQSYDFSFSGLKTAVRNVVRDLAQASPAAGFPVLLPGGLSADIAASFQAAVVDVLVRKTEWAIVRKGIRRVTLSGGVAANSEVRRRMAEMAASRDVDLFLPSPPLCTDNAAMIAAAGHHRFLAGQLAGLDLNPRACLPL